MKKVIFSLVAATALSSTLFAGKNVAPAPLPPMPIPEKPAPTPAATLPPLGLYIGGGLTYAKSECQCDNTVKCSDGSSCGKVQEGKTYGYNLKAGYDLNEYIGLEGKYFSTPWGDEDKSLKHYGLYLKPSMPVTNNIDAYALLGYGKTDCDKIGQSFKGFSWGLGTELTLGDKTSGLKNGWGVYAEYLRPIKKSGDKSVKVDTLQAGVAYHF